MQGEQFCPGCTSPCAGINKAYPAQSQNPLGLIGITECNVCNLAFAAPMPSQEQLDRFYADGTYWQKRVQPTRLLHLHGLAQGIARADWCARWIKVTPSVVADVGAGYGWQAEGLARAFGHGVSQYAFVEPDDQAAAAIEGRSMAISCRRIPRLDVDAVYDLIFLNQVLEHVARPVDFLKIAGAALRPGGRIYIETPHRDDLFKGDVFPHTLFFSKDALSYAIRCAGLELVTIEVFGRMPGAGLASLALRAAFRLAAVTGWTSAAVFLDSLLWHYHPGPAGIWLRALARRPA